MIRIYVAAGDSLVVVSRQGGGWRAELRLERVPVQCVAADPGRQNRSYCGSFGQGLWRSDDAGGSWQPVGEGIGHREVMAVAVSGAERRGEVGVVWAGTEPSALFRSEDGGDSWEERPSLWSLPSAPTWSFPPRPWTSHVRWIAPDATEPTLLYVGIELGGVMRSQDGGLTWEDRKPGSQPDCHTLATHPLAPGRVYETAGGGYAESLDGGATWRGYDEGLKWHYLWGLAVDPADPDTVLVSASPGPREAHRAASAAATIYRRAKGGPWVESRAGLPEPEGTMAYVLATHPAEPGVFYAAPHAGPIYRSADSGLSWEELPIPWPAGYRPKDIGGMAVVKL